MGLKIKIISFVVGSVFFLFILFALKRNNISPLPTCLWIIISLFLLSVPILEPFYKWISVSIIGIQDARHIIYIAIIGFLMVYAFALELKVNRLSDRVQNLISHHAIIEHRLDEREKHC